MYDAVFISYRHEGSSTFAGVLYDALCRNFPSSGVFKDKNKLLPGKDFKEGINHAIDQSYTMLVLIHNNWINLIDEKGKKRLFNEEDFIRYEIRTGLSKSKNIIPVLFEGGKMPKEEDLPDDIKKLCNYQAFEIDHDNITKSINSLIGIIKTLSTERLQNTVSGSIIRLKKDPKGTLKNVTDTYLNLAKREGNIIGSYLGKFLKKKKKDE